MDKLSLSFVVDEFVKHRFKEYLREVVKLCKYLLNNITKYPVIHKYFN